MPTFHPRLRHARRALAAHLDRLRHARRPDRAAARGRRPGDRRHGGRRRAARRSTRWSSNRPLATHRQHAVRSSPTGHPRRGVSRGHRDDDPYDDPPSEDWAAEEPKAWREVESDPPAPVPSAEPERFRLHRALAIGCQAAAWWLRGQAGRCAALVALGIGLFATGAAFVTSTVLTESALGLLTLADAVPGTQGPSFVETR